MDFKAPIIDVRQEVCNLLSILRCKKAIELEKKQK